MTRLENGTLVDEGLSVIEALLETLNPEDARKVEQALLALRHKSEHWARTCAACGGCVHELYMVREEVWLSVMPSHAGHLHLACLEKTLGRFLTIDDFPSSAANTTLLFGHRLNL